jgi:hypothetical protein
MWVWMDVWCQLKVLLLLLRVQHTCGEGAGTVL